MSKSYRSPHFHVDIERVAGCARDNASVQYVVWAPNGDVRRIALKNDSDEDRWTWAAPFEVAQGPPGNKADEKYIKDFSPDKGFSIGVSIHSVYFRSGGVGAATKANVYDRNGEVVANAKATRDTSYAEDDNDVAIVKLGADPDAPFAFGIHAYALCPRTTKPGSSKSWQWVGAALVPWTAVSNATLCSFPMFMWSDVRFECEVPEYAERVLVRRVEGIHSVPKLLATELVRDAENILINYTLNEYETVRNTCTHKLVPKEQETMRFSTFNTHIEGLGMRASENTKEMMADKVAGDNTPVEAYLGSSAQSWYYYEKTAVTAEWLVQTIDQVLALRGSTSAEFTSSVDKMIERGDDDWGSDKAEFRHVLADVVRIVTVHQTTWPYAEDLRHAPNGEAKSCDTFTCGLTVPGDCEDGAQAAYLVYMSILLTDWTMPTANLKKTEKDAVMALQKAAAYLGVPMCITGTAANPATPNFDETYAGSHSYGAIVPFLTFVGALFGHDKTDEINRACTKFEKRFGFEPPRGLYPSSVETTLFSTPTMHHEGHDAREIDAYNRAIKEIVKKRYGERSCLWRNVGYTYPLDDDVYVHVYAFKAFTDYARHVLFDGGKVNSNTHVRMLANAAYASPYSCTFAFVTLDENGEVEGMGVHRETLYDMCAQRENGVENKATPKWGLRVICDMSKTMFDLDQQIVRYTRQPVVPLARTHYDPHKSPEANARAREICKCFMNPFDHSKPHVVLHFYDMTYTYDSGRNEETEAASTLLSTAAEMNARKFVAMPHGHCTAVVFHDIVPNP